MNKIEGYHVPVMLHESIEALAIKEDGVYVDVTFGGGGHSSAILEKLSKKGHLYAFDQDEDAMKNVPNDARITFVHSNFRYLKNWMRYYGVDQIDGLLADLGVSSHHFDEAERGFTFRENGPLDMRMNRRAGKTAADIINNYDENELSQLFHLYGEVTNARQLAGVVVKAREVKPIVTINDFLDATQQVLPRDEKRRKKEWAKAFQALRIEVNHELEALKEMLTSAVELLKPDGRLVVLTYHSLEDRIAKNLMRSGNPEGVVETDFYGKRKSQMEPIGKIVQPSKDEEEINPRSRSAKLRIGRRITEI